jgi:hypothetical protein
LGVASARSLVAQRAFACFVFALALQPAVFVGAQEAATPAPTASPSPAPSDSSDSLDLVPDFNVPLSPREWYSIEDDATTSYDHLAGSSNTINLRAQIPLGRFAKKLPASLLTRRRVQLIKIKLPFVTSAPAGAVKGNGDTTLWFLQYLGTASQKWVYGPLLKIPTASMNELGSGRWSGGPAAGYTYTHGSTSLGLYAETYVSFAGPKSRGAVTQTQIQPGLFFTLPRGWLVGTSSMQFLYNWQRNAWQNVPLGFRVERFTQKVMVGVEVEKNLASVQSTTQWTFRFDVKYQLPAQ